MVAFLFLCWTEKCTRPPVSSGLAAEGERGADFGSSVCKERHKPGQVWACGQLIIFTVCFSTFWLDFGNKKQFLSLYLSTDTLHLPLGSVNSAGRDCRNLRASSWKWRRSLLSSPNLWNSKSRPIRKLANLCKKYRWAMIFFITCGLMNEECVM